MLRTSVTATHQSFAVARSESSACRMFHIDPGDRSGTSPSDDAATGTATANAASDCQIWITGHFRAKQHRYTVFCQNKVESDKKMISETEDPRSTSTRLDVLHGEFIVIRLGLRSEIMIESK